MRPRAAGGYEPDETEQRELTELWHLGATAVARAADRSAARLDRLTWVVGAFMKKHEGGPNVARKWIWVWAVDNLGLIVRRA